jgi:hypothetical protein
MKESKVTELLAQAFAHIVVYLGVGYTLVVEATIFFCNSSNCLGKYSRCENVSTVQMFHPNSTMNLNFVPWNLVDFG